MLHSVSIIDVLVVDSMIIVQQNHTQMVSKEIRKAVMLNRYSSPCIN